MYNSMKYTPGAYAWRMPCRVCVGGADYTLNVPGRGETLLCETHSRQLRSILSIVARPPSVKAGLRAAQRDAEEAIDLDPNLSEARGVLENICEALNAFQVE